MAAKQKEQEADEKSSRKRRDASRPKPAAVTTNSVMRYIRETRGELRKVVWPTREESWRLTMIVLGVTLAFIIFLGVLDWVFSSGFQAIIDLIT